MPLSKSTITGSLVLPGETALSQAKLVFTLTGFDTEGAVVVLSEGFEAALGAGGAMPANFKVWQNAAGLRNTRYRLELTGLREALPGFTRNVRIWLGTVAIGSAASYDVAELLDAAMAYEPLGIDYGFVSDEAERTADYGDI